MAVQVKSVTESGLTASFEPVVEFYVPWWAWPLEWMHRLVFGTVILCHGLSEELKDGNRSRMKEFDEKHRWD